MQQLGAMDATYLYTERIHTPQQIGILSIYDPSTAPGGEVSFDQIVEHIRGRLDLARTFRQKVVRVPFGFDHPYWVEDENFDLEYHLRQTALAPPGGWQQLWRQIARSCARPLAKDRPLWEIEVIQGLDDVEGLPKGSFAILLKVHHAAIDGLSGIEILTAIHDESPEPRPPATTSAWRPESEPGALQLVARAAVNNYKKQDQLVRAIVKAVPGVRRVVKGVRNEELPTPRPPAPLTRFNRPVSAHRSFDAQRFALADIKAIKAAVPGTTVNDVALTIVGGALRTYLESKAELPDLPLQAMAPISVRTEEEKGEMGNQVAAMTVPLRTDIADPIERLKSVAEGTRGSKELTEAIGARLLSDMSAAVPGSLIGLASRASSRPDVNSKKAFINTVVSNVPGPQDPLYFCGARMTGIYGMGPVRDGMGLFHFLSSYHGEFTISTLACDEMLPDPAFYGQCLVESFEALRSATGASPPTPVATVG